MWQYLSQQLCCTPLSNNWASPAQTLARIYHVILRYFFAFSSLTELHNSLQGIWLYHTKSTGKQTSYKRTSCTSGRPWQLHYFPKFISTGRRNFSSILLSLITVSSILHVALVLSLITQQHPLEVEKKHTCEREKMKLTSAFLDSINHECLMSEDNVKQHRKVWFCFPFIIVWTLQCSWCYMRSYWYSIHICKSYYLLLWLSY